MKRILLAGGNSGGHLYPGLSLARSLVDLGIAEVLFLDHGSLDGWRADPAVPIGKP